jgi:transcriptional regulator with GAF, ATPase, and Fis domain
MFPQYSNASSSESVLKQNQLEALKSLSQLLLREINSLEEMPSALEKEIEREKPISLLNELQHFEVKMLRCALIRAMGSQKKAAKLLGLKQTTLHAKLRRYKIDLTEF